VSYSHRDFVSRGLLYAIPSEKQKPLVPPTLLRRMQLSSTIQSNKEVVLNYRIMIRVILGGLGIALLLIPLSLQSASSAKQPAASSTIFLPLIQSGALINTGPTLAGCPMFPANNIWNARVDALPVDPMSNTYINAIGASTTLHPDFGSGLWNGGSIGIPFNLVSGSQPLVPITFDYSDESDPGPYPIPTNPAMEYGSDHHVLVLDTTRCILYETWDTRYANGWQAGSGAKFDLNSNALRPAGWTSADAAGLPILPGLVRYDEVAAGEIKHAIRFTIDGTNNSYIWPARHRTNYHYSASKPPMGQRFRLKATFDISTFSPPVQVILTAFKRYGIIVADNGSNWFISGVPDSRWNDDMLVSEFRRVRGSDFEAVNVSGLMLDPNSGQTR